jgi:putative membrane protein insertion efficiency factor
MRKLAIKMIRFYQKAKLPATSGSCRFIPSCSNYAIDAYTKHNFFYASILTFWRILRCNPLSKRRYDPVPLTRKEKQILKKLEETKEQTN